MKHPMRVGLTGGIGSGKTAVKNCFDDLGVPTVDADEISHAVTRPGQAAFDEVVALFGKECLDEAGNLDRQYLRELIFANPAMKKQLEGIIHPCVRRGIQEFITRVTYPYCIICIPLLLETGRQAAMDRVLVVDAPEELQIARVSRRDRANEDQTRSIIKAQINREERLRYAHDIIINDGNINDLKNQVVNLHDRYIELSLQKNNQ